MTAATAAGLAVVFVWLVLTAGIMLLQAAR
jgi:hypothetical protein